ncbi:MAG: hypothetical protein P1U84_12005 [Parvibaculaceae bacterium]|nr:hypothetical protein [Parvibaculaceae bacterium]
MADILLFPSNRPITKAEPRGDSTHVHLLSAAADAEKRARFARVFGTRRVKRSRPGMASGWWAGVKLEAGLCWFHLVYLLRSIGGCVAAVFRLPEPIICPELTMSTDEKGHKR